jgi:hypothetical protein
VTDRLVWYVSEEDELLLQMAPISIFTSINSKELEADDLHTLVSGYQPRKHLLALFGLKHAAGRVHAGTHQGFPAEEQVLTDSFPGALVCIDPCHAY